MAISDIAQRAAPFAQAAFDDDEVRERLRNAARQGSVALVQLRSGKQPKPSAIKRFGQAVQEAGQALVALGATSQKKQKQQQRRGRARLGLPLALATAIGAALLVSRNTSDTTTGVSNA